MLLALLAACACASFDEMEVTGANADTVAEVERAIADFAAWTGRAGVCVPAVELVDEVLVDGEEVGGTYGGPNASIRVDANARGPYKTTFHELCHALDEQEGHAAARPDLFVGDDIDNTDLYPTALDRSREAFAQECAWGGVPIEAIVAIDAACGGAYYDAPRVYVQEEVYAAYPRAPLLPGGMALRRSTRTLAVGPGVRVLDASAYADTLVLLAVWPALGHDVWGLLQVDPVGGSVLTRVVLGGGHAYADEANARLVRSDGMPVLLTGTGAERALLEVDPADGARRVLGVGIEKPDFLYDLAWSEGVLYQAGAHDGAEVTYAWDAATAVLDRAIPAVGATIGPVPGGFEAFSARGLERYVDGVATVFPASSLGEPEMGHGAWDIVTLPDGGRLVVQPSGAGSMLVSFHPEAGAYGLPAAPCQPVEEAFYWQSWANVGDEIVLLRPGEVDVDGSFVVEVLGE